MDLATVVLDFLVPKKLPLELMTILCVARIFNTLPSALKKYCVDLWAQRHKVRGVLAVQAPSADVIPIRFCENLGYNRICDLLLYLEAGRQSQPPMALIGPVGSLSDPVIENTFIIAVKRIVAHGDLDLRRPFEQIDRAMKCILQNHWRESFGYLITVVNRNPNYNGIIADWALFALDHINHPYDEDHLFWAMVREHRSTLFGDNGLQIFSWFLQKPCLPDTFMTQLGMTLRSARAISVRTFVCKLLNGRIQNPQLLFMMSMSTFAYQVLETNVMAELAYRRMHDLKQLFETLFVDNWVYTGDCHIVKAVQENRRDLFAELLGWKKDATLTNKYQVWEAVANLAQTRLDDAKWFSNALQEAKIDPEFGHVIEATRCNDKGKFLFFRLLGSNWSEEQLTRITYTAATWNALQILLHVVDQQDLAPCLFFHMCETLIENKHSSTLDRICKHLEEKKILGTEWVKLVREQATRHATRTRTFSLSNFTKSLDQALERVQQKRVSFGQKRKKNFYVERRKKLTTDKSQ